MSGNVTIGGTYTFQVNGGSNVSAAFGEYSLSVPGRIAIGDSGSSNNTFDLASGTINGSGYIFVGRGGGSSNTFRISNPGTSVSAANRVIAGYNNNSTGNSLIVANGANLTVSGSGGRLEAGGNTSGNFVFLDGAGTINVSQYGCRSRS